MREGCIAKCLPNTMTNVKRLSSLWDIVVETKGLNGDLVEAGVYKGGCSMMMAFALKYINSDKKLFLLDTFKGMTKPCEKDVKVNKGTPYFNKWEENNKGDFNNWCYSPLDEVKKNLLKTDYPNIEFIERDVCDTIPDDKIKNLSVLRLDVDFYKGTFHLLSNLFHLLETGGYLIIDDYNCWEGCKEAVNEFFLEEGLNINDLEEIDHSCVIYIKK